MVFISHSSKDGESLDLVKNAIRKSGMKPYVALEHRTPGASISSKITEKIDESDVLGKSLC